MLFIFQIHISNFFNTNLTSLILYSFSSLLILINKLTKEVIIKNTMSLTDRIIRLVIVAVIAILIFQNVLTGTAAIILGILAGVLAVTSVLGFCPLYALFKLSTKKS